MIYSILFLAFSVAPGQPPVVTETVEPPLAPIGSLKLPEAMTTQTGKLAVIRAETTCKRATWILPAAIQADMNEGGLKLTFVAPKGHYILYCVVATGTDQPVIAKITLEVSDGEVKPVPPEPKPPDPLPKPPEPKPPAPPEPQDQFVAELIKLFPADGDKRQAGVLAAIYRLAAREALSPANATFADLLSLITEAIDSATSLGPKALRSVRERVRDELVKVVPNLDSDLTKETRKLVDSAYSRAAVAMEMCAK